MSYYVDNDNALPNYDAWATRGPEDDEDIFDDSSYGDYLYDYYADMQEDEYVIDLNPRDYDPIYDYVEYEGPPDDVETK